MKKLLSALTLAVLSYGGAEAQTRLSLYEEFTGENCGPCAATNPGFQALLNGTGNASKIMMIAYQVPIPSAGPIYLAYPTVSNARRAYYGVTSAPNGRLDGTVSSPSSASPGHPGYMTQSEINNAAAVASPFNMTATHSWNGTGDSITANVTITSAAAYAPAGANLVLRVALIEDLSYCTAPGTNGETDFHHVVREMYPDAAGTAISNTWTASQTQTYTIKGKVPTSVDKSNDKAILVVWIQNDANKNIMQAATSSKVALTLDAALTGCAAGTLACQATGSSTASVNVPLTITNTGSSTLTSATIYYKVDNGTLASKPWTGSLAAGASASTSVTVTATSGNHTVYDSLATPNSSADINTVNNAKKMPLTVRDATPVALPLTEDFENASVPAMWSLFDANGNGQNWARRAANGHNGSMYTFYHNNYNFASGETNYAVLPTPSAGAKGLDFYYAYAQYSTENDKLEVVYSTNCGTSWTTLWSAAGTTLATHAPVGNNAQFFPAIGDDDWKMVSVDLSSIPSGATIAFRATSDFGNNLFIDDINLRNAAAAGIAQVLSNGDVSLYPNPATEKTTLQLNLLKESSVTISLLDAVGRTVAIVADGKLSAGTKTFAIPTNTLPAGVYTVSVRTAEGGIAKRLSVVK